MKEYKQLGAYTLILKDDKILLIKKKKSYWLLYITNRIAFLIKEYMK